VNVSRIRRFPRGGVLPAQIGSTPCPLVLEWPEIAERLALTLIAGVLIGLDRDEHGGPAGLRTTLLDR